MARKSLRAAVAKWIIGSLYDDLKWLNGGDMSKAGQLVNDETAMRVAAWHSCVKVISETISSLPLQVFERTTNGKNTATSHPLYNLLAQKPNSWQTSMEFREMMTGFALMRGNAYAYIVKGKSILNGIEYIRELIPIHPDRMNVTQNADYSLTYQFSRSDGTLLTLYQNDVFHLRGFSTNGYMGRSLIHDARELLGKSLGMQEYSSMLFANGATPGLVLSHPNKLSEASYKRLTEQSDSRHAGSGKAHKTMIVEEGMTATKLSFTAEDTQFIETTKLTRSEIAGICRVPPHMIGDLDRATFSNIEEQNISFVTHCIRQWAVRWEQALLRDLFIAPERFFPEHNLEGLLRGNTLARFQAYAIGRTWGWLSANDIRARESMNGIGPEGDVYLSPTNMQDAAALLTAMGGTQNGNQK